MNELNLEVRNSTLNLCAANGTAIEIKGRVEIECTIAGETTMHEFYVSDLDCPVTLGSDLIFKLGLVLDFGRKVMWSNRSKGPITIKHPS